MPLNHLLGRRKRDRLELDMNKIGTRCEKLKDLPVALQSEVDAATACILEILSDKGADTFDRGDLLALGMGATLMHQVTRQFPGSVEPFLYELVIQAIVTRIELLEEAARTR